MLSYSMSSKALTAWDIAFTTFRDCEASKQGYVMIQNLSGVSIYQDLFNKHVA